MKPKLFFCVVVVALVSVVALPSFGQDQFVKTLGGTDDDWGSSLILPSYPTFDGGSIVVTGGTYCFGAGGIDFLLVKFNASGNPIWTTTLGGSNQDWAHSVIQAPGGFVVAGHTWSFGAGGRDLLLAKFDADGEHLWTKALGGENDEWVYSVTKTSDGGLVVTGGTYSFGAGNCDSCLPSSMLMAITSGQKRSEETTMIGVTL